MFPLRIIGVRAWNEGFRYGVCDDSSGAVVWVNAQDEHRWLIPEAANNRQAQTEAAYAEWRRVLEVYSPVDTVVVKMPEYGRSLDIATSLSLAIATAVSLASSHTHIALKERVYANIKLSSKSVEAYTLQYVNRPTRYWDLKLADALAVALKEFE